MRHNSYSNNEASSTASLATTNIPLTNDYYLPKLSKSQDSNYSSSTHKDTEIWKQTEYTIKDNLQQFDMARKFCAYCGQTEGSISESLSSDEQTQQQSNHLTLGRCYGCQMVYYCNQEHQHLDWLENHMPKCAELEWVALGELIQSIPIALPLPKLAMWWPDTRLG